MRELRNAPRDVCMSLLTSLLSPTEPLVNQGFTLSRWKHSQSIFTFRKMEILLTKSLQNGSQSFIDHYSRFALKKQLSMWTHAQVPKQVY